MARIAAREPPSCERVYSDASSVHCERRYDR